jgi:acyl-CoA synthetase (AMP-forming)/AMP-acid ligase II
VRTDPALLRDWLVQQGITITFVPTPMAEQLMQLEWPHTNSPRILLTGADTLHRYPSVDLPFQLVNNYGPTECTVVSTSASIAPSEAADSLPPIGRPIDNVRVYILDEKMQPVPLGNEGELYIGGAGVARGYRNRPELTKERFVPDPFVPGARLYRSGDSVRYLNDGQLAFLGRIDEQVKIRGYRIEPSEIVAALNACSMIRASYVMAHEDEAGNRRLVAYIAPESEQSLTDKDIRAFLSTRIPDYMIPAVFVVMESLPINASGKIDRKSLPEPSELNILKDETYVSPRSAIEHAVAGMMSTLLRFDKIGLNDNFFLLGGNSLLGAQVIARVRETFDVELSLLGLFDNPTVAELSAEIERLILAKLDAKSEEDANQLARSAGQE